MPPLLRPRLAALAAAFLLASSLSPSSAQVLHNTCRVNAASVNVVNLVDADDGAERSAVGCMQFGAGSYPTIQQFNDRASRIQVGQNVKALVCTEVNFGGVCALVQPGSGLYLRDLPAVGNNAVSSIKVARAATPDVELTGNRVDTSPPPASTRFPLASGQTFQRGQRYTSESGSHYLVFQPDGNLVVYTSDNRFVWGLNTVTDQFGRIARIGMQPDGNLAAYDARDGYIWSALTENPDPAARLVLTSGGALQVISPSRGVLWSSDGNRSPEPDKGTGTSTGTTGTSTTGTGTTTTGTSTGTTTTSPADAMGQGFPFTAGQSLQREQRYPSPSGNHALTLAPDGNLIVSRADGGYHWGFDQIPSINRARVAGVKMQADGNLVAVDAKGAVVWQALRSNPDPAARLELTSTGGLQLVSPGRGVLWASDGVLIPEGVAGQGFPFTAGQTIPAGTPFPSPSGGHVLTFQPGDNLVVSTNGSYRWGFDKVPNLNRSNIRSVRMTQDGNLVALDAKGQPIWRAVTSNPDPAARLEMTYNGALQLVSPSRGVLWSSDGILASPIRVVGNTPNASTCEAETGWSKCLQLTTPALTITGTERVTDAAMKAVANVYTELFGRLKPAFPQRTFDGFRVYVTNGETEAQLRTLSPISPEFGKDGYGPDARSWIRGGANGNFLWIEEQMICKQGVQTRNADFAAGQARTRDDTYRTFDQVIHEMGHSIDSRYNLMNTRLRSVYSGDPTEQFPQGIQAWFGVPFREISVKEKALMESLFTSRATFSCEGYTP